MEDDLCCTNFSFSSQGNTKVVLFGLFNFLTGKHEGCAVWLFNFLTGAHEGCAFWSFQFPPGAQGSVTYARADSAGCGGWKRVGEDQKQTAVAQRTRPGPPKAAVTATVTVTGGLWRRHRPVRHYSHRVTALLRSRAAPTRGPRRWRYGRCVGAAAVAAVILMAAGWSGYRLPALPAATLQWSTVMTAV